MNVRDYLLCDDLAYSGYRTGNPRSRVRYSNHCVQPGKNKEYIVESYKWAVLYGRVLNAFAICFDPG